MTGRGSATVYSNMAYFRLENSGQVHSYNSYTEKWSTLPACPTYNFTLTVVNGLVNGLVTAVGGEHLGNSTKMLLSIEKGGPWFQD